MSLNQHVERKQQQLFFVYTFVLIVLGSIKIYNKVKASLVRYSFGLDGSYLA